MSKRKDEKERKQAQLEEMGIGTTDSRKLYHLLQEFEAGTFTDAKALVELFIATWGAELFNKGERREIERYRTGTDQRGVFSADTRLLIKGIYRLARKKTIKFIHIEWHLANCTDCGAELAEPVPKWECRGLQFAIKKQFGGLVDDTEIWKKKV